MVDNIPVPLKLRPFNWPLKHLFPGPPYQWTPGLAALIRLTRPPKQ